MHKMLTALLLGATIATPVLAQDRGPDDRRPRAADGRDVRADRGDFDGREDRGPDGPIRAEPPGQFDQPGQRPGPAGRFAPRDDRRDRGGPGGFNDRREPRDARFDGQRGDRFEGGPRGGRPGGYDRYDDRGGYRWQGGSAAWNRDWRRDDRYDWQSYRRTNDRAFRAPRYYGPQGSGYGYRRWSAGYRIQPAFYGQNYWIARPELYRLPPAYGGYRWVRYYNDVALVDIRSGLIEDILYGFFL
ncbi:RcnB family protein [Sphingomonas prati]|uniref:Ni/Co efflux regulator RcnB n=1 Tax=Sphingomonas prati TaxID=1843237 RepID=A0A7W9BRV3_9SPHN|nr:RcnB family protein [Sphingomonas prati]MBB5728998.1 Ni/Co efflux regulator RcnB [Sphingomonas prati]GGE85862.1 hypothetical protein GCM10011404_18340 [Sphingomonas prati]